MIRYINPPGADKPIITTLATQNENGLMSFFDKSKIDNYLLYSNNSLNLEDFPFGGSIGPSSSTVDISSSISIKQTTSNQTILIPSPTNNTNVRYLFISNIGVASFNCLNSTFLPSIIKLFVWNTSSWNLLVSNEQNIFNDFNVISVNTNYNIPNWNSAVLVDSQSNTINIVLPPTNASNQGKLVVISKNSSQDGTIIISSNPSTLLNILPYTAPIIINQITNLYESVVILSTIYGPYIISTSKLDPVFSGNKAGWVPNSISKNLFLKDNGSWESPLLDVVDVSSNINVEINKEYHVDTTTQTINIILPVGDINGSTIRIIDSNNTWINNPVILSTQSSQKINGNDNILNVNYGPILELYFNKLTNNWLLNNKIYNDKTTLPNTKLEEFNKYYFINYFSKLSSSNINSDTFLCSYNNNSNAYEYDSAVFDPVKNRIYMIPYGNQCTENNWHYIDCYTGSIISYIHGANVVNNGYLGGCYDPIKRRIYLIPEGQSNQSQWHYIDCNTGNVVEYINTSNAVENAYCGGCYDPINKRIYLIPEAQGIENNWHYIDCENGNIVSYIHNATIFTLSPFIGGSYSPTLKRIYLCPYGDSNQSLWYYIDCQTGNVVYYNSNNLIQWAYQGSVYSPIQDRIYFIPSGISDQNTWHYIDNKGNIVLYMHNFSIQKWGYWGGVYSPTQNRIYMCPWDQSSQSKWHYIDCNDDTVKEYDSITTSFFGGMFYCPIKNLIYLLPRGTLSLNWYYIDCLGGERVSKAIISSTLFNKSI
jgi:hypothetical protein